MKNKKRYGWLFLLAGAVLLSGCGRKTLVLQRTGNSSDAALTNAAMQEETAALASADEAAADVSEKKETEAQTLTADGRGETQAWEGTGTDTAAEESAGITVHVCGAVAVPGVYRMPAGSRIYEAVACAGGFLAEADREWCNQAQTLSDGDELLIHSADETARMKEQGITPESDRFGIIPAFLAGESADGGAKAGGAGASGGASQTGETGLVNLNTADLQELMTLSGIGQTRAEDIIAYRQQHGGFTDISQIKEISGIGEVLYSRLRDQITVF